MRKLINLAVAALGCVCVACLCACVSDGPQSGAGSGHLDGYESRAIILSVSDFNKLKDGWFSEGIYKDKDFLSESVKNAAVTELTVGEEYYFAVTTRGYSEEFQALEYKCDISATAFTEELTETVRRTSEVEYLGDEQENGTQFFLSYNGNVSIDAVGGSGNARACLAFKFMPFQNCNLNFTAGIYPKGGEAKTDSVSAYASSSVRAEIKDFKTYYVSGADCPDGDVNSAPLTPFGDGGTSFNENEDYYIVADFTLSAQTADAAGKKITAVFVVDNAEAHKAILFEAASGDFSESVSNGKKFIRVVYTVPESGERKLRVCIRVTPDRAAALTVNFCFGGDGISCSGMSYGDTAAAYSFGVWGKMYDSYGNVYYMNGDGASCRLTEPYKGDYTEYKVLSECDGVPVTGIGDGAFKNNKKLKSVEIPDGVTSIGEEAFAGCSALTNVNVNVGVSGISSQNRIYLPSTLKRIGKRAFYGVYRKNLVSVPRSVEFIGQEAFGGIELISELTVPFVGSERGADGSAGMMAYIVGEENCLMKVTVTDSDTVVSFAFQGCKELITVAYGKEVREIQKRAFSGCVKLREINITGVEVIGDYAFSGCSEMYDKNAFLPDGVKIIGESAYYGTGLASVTIPSSVTRIGEDAFYRSGVPVVITFENVDGWYDGTTDKAVDISKYDGKTAVYRKEGV